MPPCMLTPRRRAVTGRPGACEGAEAERLNLPHQAGLQGQYWPGSLTPKSVTFSFLLLKIFRFEAVAR